MVQRGQWIAAVVAVVVVGWTSDMAAREHSGAPITPHPTSGSHARVRGGSPRVNKLLVAAAAQSTTIRGLIESINATDGIVYIVEGDCRQGVGACLIPMMEATGPDTDRMLRILIDPGKTDREFMVSMGHELQHAMEVLSAPSVRTTSAVHLLYLRIGLRFGPGVNETEAARSAGDAVRAELP